MTIEADEYEPQEEWTPTECCSKMAELGQTLADQMMRFAELSHTIQKYILFEKCDLTSTVAYLERKNRLYRRAAVASTLLLGGAIAAIALIHSDIFEF